MCCRNCGLLLANDVKFCVKCGSAKDDKTANAPLDSASFSKRARAFLIDYALLSLIGFPLANILLPVQPIERAFVEAGPGADDPQLRLLIFFRFGLLFALNHVCYFFYSSVLDCSSRQGSIGKRYVGLLVVDIDGSPLSFRKSTWRQLCRFASILPGHLGFVWPWWHAKRQTFHDILSGTCVVVSQQNARRSPTVRFS